MTMMSLMVTVAVVIAAPALAGGGESPVARQASVDGRSVFKTYCASCHGESGRGNGAVAVFLRRPPADLTQIAKRNKGVFPADQVSRQIDGRQVVKAHGDSQMPVWGDAFSKATVGSDEASIKAKIEVTGQVPGVDPGALGHPVPPSQECTCPIAIERHTNTPSARWSSSVCTDCCSSSAGSPCISTSSCREDVSRHEDPSLRTPVDVGRGGRHRRLPRRDRRVDLRLQRPPAEPRRDHRPLPDLRGPALQARRGTRRRRRWRARGADGCLHVRVHAQRGSRADGPPGPVPPDSADVVHGFMVSGTNANAMLVPGYVTQFTTVFPRAGDYLVVCHEFCGNGHHAMFGRIIVEGSR